MKLHETINEINKCIGSLSWQDKVCDLTTLFLDSISKENKPVPQVLEFVCGAKAFDQTQIVDFIIQHGVASQIIELGISTPTINCTDLLKYYLNSLEENPNGNEIKEMAVKYACSIWPHLDIIDLTDWAIECKDHTVMLACVLNYPFHHMALEDQFDVLIHILFAEQNWLINMQIFLTYPALYDEYKDQYSIEEVLKDDSETIRPIIKEFVVSTYNRYPMDIELHNTIIHLSANPFVVQCFVDMATESFQALHETTETNVEV